ncbi:MAG: tetratricopeptide repeat protein [Candidatus Methylopumilus sp.]|jgi:predicted O-linked N-acetylglucosamine transferase (SPINDLY family)
MSNSTLSADDIASTLLQIEKNLQSADFIASEKACIFLLDSLGNDFLGSKGNAVSKIMFYLGASLDAQNRYEEALGAFSHVVELDSYNVDAWYAKASIYSKMKLLPQALDSAKAALAIKKDNPKSLSTLAIAYQQLGDYTQAITFYSEALAIDDSDRSALLNLSFLLVKNGQAALAKNYCQKALISWVKDIDFYINLAEAHIQLFEFEPAKAICKQGLAIAPDNVALTFKYGLVLAYTHDFDFSRHYLAQARLMRPEIVKDYYPHIYEYIEKNKAMDAELLIVPEQIYLNMASHQQKRCDWHDRDFYINFISDFLLKNSDVVEPHVLVDVAIHATSLPIFAHNRKLLAGKIAEEYVEVAWLKNMMAYQHKPMAKSKLRIGYISPDFRRHPVGILTRLIYGLHDRDKYEIYCYSLVIPQDKNDESYKVISTSCDFFIDVSEKDFVAIANQIYGDGIDILVDLAGYTGYAKTEVLALRPAPIQIAYLGFPGTLNAPFIDYLITDSVIAPKGSDDEWGEQLIRLPDANIPFDYTICNQPIVLNKHDFNLPEQSFVLCCFNANYKIDPVIFNSWIKLLKAIPNSILWLVATHPATQNSLLKLLINEGVDGERLIFAPFTSYTEHIKRYQVADLFLDTLWHNAHTTAIDALWQGLPVITCMGEVPSARLAASLLNALEMPELITKNLDEYEKLVIWYAQNHQVFNSMREKLKAKRFTAPLFNTELTVRHIEHSYQVVWQRYQQGLPTEKIDVQRVI